MVDVVVVISFLLLLLATVASFFGVRHLDRATHSSLLIVVDDRGSGRVDTPVKPNKKWVWISL